MDIVSRLKRFIEYLGLPNSSFADRAHITRPTLSQILNGRNKKISNELIGKLHDAFPMLNIMWLMFGDGDMLTTAAAASSDNVPTSDNASLIPDTENVVRDMEDPVPYGNANTMGNGATDTSRLEKANGFDLNFFELNQGPAQSVYSDSRNSGQSASRNASTRSGAHTAGNATSQEGAGHSDNKGGDKAAGSSKNIPGSFWDDVTSSEIPADGNSAAASAAAAVADNGKSVSYIMVFYSDSSYEMFKPQRDLPPQR